MTDGYANHNYRHNKDDPDHDLNDDDFDDLLNNDIPPLRHDENTRKCGRI